MRNSFFELTGENADLLSDLGARFQAVASELFNLACYGDFVLRQSFIQTASGEYLDRHAELRGITRKTASKAYGELTFSLVEALESDVEIPQGTICSVENSAYIQFATTQSAVISAGELSVTVPALAVENGAMYNAKAGTVTVIVNPPGYIDAVTNEFAFTGGYDAESDESLRKRLLESYSVPPTGLSEESMKEAILKLDDVLDCNIVKHSVYAFYVYLKTKTNTLSQELEDAVSNAVLVAYLVNSTPTIALASCSEYDLNISVILNGGSAEEAQSVIEERIRDFVNSVKIGEDIDLNILSNLMLYYAPIKQCSITSPQAVNGVITASESTYLQLDELTVNCYE